MLLDPHTNLIRLDVSSDLRTAADADLLLGLTTQMQSLQSDISSSGEV